MEIPRKRHGRAGPETHADARVHVHKVCVFTRVGGRVQTVVSGRLGGHCRARVFHSLPGRGPIAFRRGPGDQEDGEVQQKGQLGRVD